MSKFLGLIKREYILNSAISYTILALVTITVFFIPIGLEQYRPSYNAEQTRFLLVNACAVLIGINALFMTIASINKDIKIKEIWLHHTKSIYELVGAKVMYQLLVMLVIGFVNFIGYFFVGNIIQGTFSQYIVLAFCYFYVLTSVFLIFVVVFIVCNSFIKHLVALIGKVGNIIGFIVLMILLSRGDLLPTLTFLQIGQIPMPEISNYLPRFNDDIIRFTMYEVYIVEELVFLVVLVFLYIIGCKWLERVITR